MEIERVDLHFDDGTLLTVLMNDLACASLRASGTSVEHMICHHHEHMNRDCECLYGELGMTVMMWPGEVALVIEGPSFDGSYAIMGLTAEELAAL